MGSWKAPRARREGRRGVPTQGWPHWSTTRRNHRHSTSTFSVGRHLASVICSIQYAKPRGLEKLDEAVGTLTIGRLLCPFLYCVNSRLLIKPKKLWSRKTITKVSPSIRLPILIDLLHSCCSGWLQTLSCKHLITAPKTKIWRAWWSPSCVLLL